MIAPLECYLDARWWMRLIALFLSCLRFFLVNVFAISIVYDVGAIA